MRVLVTGGGGYLGAAVVHHLLAGGHEVRVLDLLLSGGQSLMTACHHPGFDIVVGDIRDRRATARALAGCDVVLHLAAIVGTPACDRDPETARGTNVGGTATLLAARQPGQRLVFASTGSVYGAVASGHCDEQTPAEPTTLYGRTKLEAERMVREAGDSVVLRLGTVFGVGRAPRWDLLVNDLTRRAVEAGALTVFQPEARRSFIHVADVARALSLPVEEWERMRDGLFNVGDAALDTTKGDLARLICAETGAALAFDAIGEDPDKRDYTMSFARIAALGFASRRSLLDGVRELAKAAKLANGQLPRSGQ